MRVLGLDLAWGEGAPGRPANETGVVATDPDGQVLDAGWARGLDDVESWIGTWAGADAIALVDAPLVVRNAAGMRECERQVARHYGRWKVSANASNLGLAALAGVSLVGRLAADGWRAADARHGPPGAGRWLYESFPYATLVGAPELGYDSARPIYKRRPPTLTPAEFRALRAENVDDLVRRLGALRAADPPIDIGSHPVTAALLDEPSPLVDRAAKHREDLVDAVVLAWSGLLWLRHGLDRCVVLGDPTDDTDPPAQILAAIRPEQRR